MTDASHQSSQCDHNEVVVTTGGLPADKLGMIRAFGRRDIPVVYLDPEPGSNVRYSKYIITRLKSGNEGIRN